MLFLIGLGLDKKNISAGALEAMKKADLLLLETYTAFISNDYISLIEKETRKKIRKIERKDLEEDLKNTVALAKKKKIAILVPGDPLIATTHSIILNEARKQHIKFEVFHAPSVFSAAIGESGLDVYRFGPTVTLPFWFKNYKPTSFLDAIRKNMKNNQHTLLLLDIDQKNKAPMRIEDAVVIFSDAVKKAGSSPFKNNFRFIILANLGRKGQLLCYLSIKQISPAVGGKLKNKVLSLIIPAKLSFAEEDNLKRVLEK